MNIHFIGICGVGMSALAIALHKNGHIVTGSDVGFYPPVSTHLKNAGVNYYPGWHPEQMGTPDLVVVGNVAGSTNPEWLRVQEDKIPFVSYPELIEKYLIAKNSIVCAGTFGKTTSTTILSWILSKTGKNPNYMFGGICADSSFPSAHIENNAEWSVVEGDEYKTAKWDEKAKFFHYHPTHILLTAAVWDHADVYKTENSYTQAFCELLQLLPNGGTAIISEKAKHLPISENAHVQYYGVQDWCDIRYTNVLQTKEGTSFTIHSKGQTYAIHTKMLGEFTADNMTGCFAMAETIGISQNDIVNALESFPGVKRRMEKRFSGKIDVYDDIAHSPTKAKAVIDSIRKIYNGKIFVVFEPNTGNRKSASFSGYDHAFDSADTVIIPKLTRIKVDPNDADPPKDGETLQKIITKTHQKTEYIEEDKKLTQYLFTEPKEGDAVLFLGSHGFRGMIEELISLHQ